MRLWLRRGSTSRKLLITFCMDASDGSTRFATSGVRSRVFLRHPPDAYAEPAGWLVLSLRSGRMAARVVYGLDAAVGAPGSKVANLSALDHTHASRFTPVSHQLYVKSSVLNGCGAVPSITLKLLLPTAAASH